MRHGISHPTVCALRCLPQEAVLRAAPHPDLVALNGVNVGVGGRQVHPSLIGVDAHRGRPEAAGGELKGGRALGRAQRGPGSGRQVAAGETCSHHECKLACWPPNCLCSLAHMRVCRSGARIPAHCGQHAAGMGRRAALQAQLAGLHCQPAQHGAPARPSAGRAALPGAWPVGWRCRQ